MLDRAAKSDDVVTKECLHRDKRMPETNATMGLTTTQKQSRTSPELLRGAVKARPPHEGESALGRRDRDVEDPISMAKVVIQYSRPQFNLSTLFCYMCNMLQQPWHMES